MKDFSSYLFVWYLVCIFQLRCNFTMLLCLSLYMTTAKSMDQITNFFFTLITDPTFVIGVKCIIVKQNRALTEIFDLYLPDFPKSTFQSFFTSILVNHFSGKSTLEPFLKKHFLNQSRYTLNPLLSLI